MTVPVFHHRFARLAALFVAVLVVSSACSASTEVVASASAVADAQTAASEQSDSVSAEPATTTDGAAATDTVDSNSTETSADAEWMGPEWLVLPAGVDVNYSLAPGTGQDAFVQGAIADEVTSADAVAQVRQQLLDQGYSLVNDTPEWVVGVDSNGDFVQVGASGFDTRTLAVTFFTPEGAELAGLVATLDTMIVTLNGEMFELQGQCSDSAEGFSGSTGGSFVSISGTPGDYSVFLTITDPAGTEWSALGGTLTDISPAGFTLTTSVTDGIAFVEAGMVATC